MEPAATPLASFNVRGYVNSEIDQLEKTLESKINGCESNCEQHLRGAIAKLGDVERTFQALQEAGQAIEETGGMDGC